MTNNKWFVYILECEDKSLYTGYSSNIKKRFLIHCSGKGAKYTISHKPRKILHTERYNTKIEAMRKERQIKEWPRQKKLDFINKIKNRKSSRQDSSVDRAQDFRQRRTSISPLKLAA